VKPLERVPPKIPLAARKSSVSGYTIVQFDLDDEGKTINHKVVVSWPPDTYEKAALKSLAKWEYSPRVEGETDADRSNLISTIRFNINDRNGNPVY
jgi:TonB family protein